MEILAKTYRGEVEDLYTLGTIVLMDSSGKKIYEKGDGSEIAFPRSSAKLMQAMVPLSLGVAEKYNFSSAEVSQICASHSGEAFHIETVQKILSKIGLDESALSCGAHYPYKADIAEEMKKQGIEARQIHNNCSGKHSGMLASAVVLGADTKTYFKPENEVQKRIIRMIANICEYPKEKIKVSIDGCGVPVHALPIETFAYGMARLGDYQCLPSDLQAHAKKIVDSIFEQPVYASGSDRIDYFVMAKSGEKMVVKSGANGYFAGCLPERKQGFAIKCYQQAGVERNRILIAFLKKIGIIQEKDYEFFDSKFDNKIYNHKKEVVGKIEELV